MATSRKSEGEKERRRDGGKQGENETIRRKQEIRRHTDLDVYNRAFKVAMRIFEITKQFPRDERYSLTDQIRRSSRSVCANLAEGWRKRRYENAFISKLGDSEGEAAETQVWIQFAVECGYLERKPAEELYREYDNILGMLISMITHADTWILRK